jgi:hypothetical protein
MHNAWLQLVIRMSAPTFIIVFGVFLELVYARDMLAHGMPYVARKLWSRSIQCYVLYVISCMVLALSEGYSGKYLLRMVLMAGATPYTDILKFYSVMLLLAPLLISLRQRYGLMPLAVFCLAVHVIHYFFYPLPYYQDFPGADIISGFLYGATTVIAGPSVLHGITFVVAGMWLGDCIRANIGRDRILDLKDHRVLLVWLIGIAGLVLGTRHMDFVSEFSSMGLRNSNSYLYFLFGIAGATLIIDGSMRLAKAVGFEPIRPFLLIGRPSQVILCLGN